MPSPASLRLVLSNARALLFALLASTLLAGTPARAEEIVIGWAGPTQQPHALALQRAAQLAVDEAIQRSGSVDPAVIAATLHGMSYDGLTGRIAFDADGRLRDPAYALYQVEQGRWKVLRSFP